MSDFSEESTRIRPRRVSFPAIGNIQHKENEEPDGETGNVNRAFSPDPDSVQTLEMEDLQVPVQPSLSRRRVSVTASGDAVIVRNAHKSYKSGIPVLNGLNLTVPCGSIYGLLGSSGCGKTTVLSCLVGQRKLDKGDIWIFGQKPGTKSIGVPGRNIGYMPQDISLYLEFSIGETLNYFGTLSGLTKEQIESAKEFLVKLLDLPEDRRRINTLSGGQQRRVSFASALIHQPQLLVLDEPTVGLDAILRESIWMYLQKLVSTKTTTVIITTHYIEECRQADNIGIMRSGRLIAERQPKELFAEHGTANLEKIVLKLSRKDTHAKLDPAVLAEAVENAKRKKGRRWMLCKTDVGDVSNKPKESNGAEMKMASVMFEAHTSYMDSLVRVQAMTAKNFTILLRNPLLLFFVVLLCSVMVIVMCVALGNDPHYLRIGLVNNEVDYLTICPNITRVPDECNVENISCSYLSHIPDDSLYLKVYANVDEAVDAVHKGITWGYIQFPNDFSVKLYERISSGSSIDDLTFNASQIIVKLDESNKQIAASIKKVLQDAYKDFTRTFLSDCGYDPRQAEAPLVYRKPLFGKDDVDFREFLAPGITPALLFFYPIITTSIRFIKEKRNGISARSQVGGVQTWEVMLAYSISEFCVLLCQSLLVYGVLAILFQIKIMGSHSLVIAMFLLSGYGGVAMGFMLGTLCSEEIEAAILTLAAFFPNMILSGLVWPVEGMPEALQYFVEVLPSTLTGEAVRSIISRGWEFTHPKVWPGFVVMVGYIAGFFLLTVLYHKIIKR